MENQNITAPVPTVEVVDIQFRPGQKVYYFSPAGIACKAGDHVIIDTARGPEYGTCVAGNHTIRQSEIVAPLRNVLRIATEQDEKIAKENQQKEQKAFAICLEKIRQQELDMQLVSAECAFDGSKILFFFTADERVDFRELVKSLASSFHTRIELRQIGVRDKAKMVGGLGICGRPFCCASFLEDFQPVSIKMAKTQNLSLNPTKISGTCGRLMCCLKYEQEAYEDLIRNSPKLESFVDTPDGRGTVAELDLLRQRVKVRLENRPETLSTYDNDAVAVFRNGKAKKTDPPIPADWAPISGNRRNRRFQSEASMKEEPAFLDPIKFRYSTEAVVEEVPAEKSEEVPEEKEQKEHRSRNRRRRSKNKPSQEAPKAKAAPAQEAPKAQPKKEQSAPAEKSEQAKKPHRRPNHRRRRPKKPGEGSKES